MFKCGPHAFESESEADWIAHNKTVSHPKTRIHGWCTQCNVVRIRIVHNGLVNQKHMPGMCAGCKKKAHDEYVAEMQAQGGQQ